MFDAVVIGLGNIGMGYDLESWNKDTVLTHTKAYLKHNSFNLVCGIDNLKKKRKIFIKYTGKPAYKGISSIKNKNIDIVSVCVPTEQHLAVIEQIVNFLRPKCILCEKPIADNRSDYLRILDLCDKNNIRLAVNYIRRWNLAVSKLRELFKKGFFGRIETIHCYYTKGLFNNASHSIDLLQYWFGKQRNVKVISCKKSVKKGDLDVSFVLYYEDFEAVFQCGNANDYRIFEIDILSEEGRIQYKDEKVRFYKRIKDNMYKNCNRLDNKFCDIKNDMEKYQYNVINGIYEVLKYGKRINSDGNSAGDTLITCLEVKKLCKNLP